MDNRPSELPSKTPSKKTGCGTLFVTLGFQNDKVVEIFCHGGKAGNCRDAYSEALARVIAVALAHGAKTEEIAEHLEHIRCESPFGLGPNLVMSCPDAIAQVLREAE